MFVKRGGGNSDYSPASGQRILPCSHSCPEVAHGEVDCGVRACYLIKMFKGEAWGAGLRGFYLCCFC